MKILYVTTISTTINAFLIPHIEMLVNRGYQVDIASNICRPLDQKIVEMGCKIYDIPFNRSPLKNNFTVINREFNKVLLEDYDLIHTHTPIASAIVRWLCKDKSKLKIVYTAHGFHFYKNAPIFNWLTYYPLEKYLSKYTDLLITINQEDYNRAKHFDAKFVRKVPGVGFSVDAPKDIVPMGSTKQKLKLISVGELNDNKNHRVVIKALSNIDRSRFEYFICGNGPNMEKLKALIKSLNLEKNVFLLGYRNDVPELLKASDIFIFPSIREGLSVSMMEAMASGLPIICSNIRGNNDLIVENQGGFLVDPMSVNEFEQAITTLVDDSIQRKKFSEFNIERIKDFSLEKVLEELAQAYSLIIDTWEN